MTALRTAAQQALEALYEETAWFGPTPKGAAAITALRAALAQQAEPVEPVAWRYQDARGNYRYRGYVQGFDKEYSLLKPVPLYTAPPQRKFVPLTVEEIERIWRDGGGVGRPSIGLIRAIEQALKEQNR